MTTANPPVPWPLPVDLAQSPAQGSDLAPTPQPGPRKGGPRAGAGRPPLSTCEHRPGKGPCRKCVEARRRRKAGVPVKVDRGLHPQPLPSVRVTKATRTALDARSEATLYQRTAAALEEWRQLTTGGLVRAVDARGSERVAPVEQDMSGWFK